MANGIIDPRRFYVYVLFRRNGIPCYVGKGCGNRYRAHYSKSHNHHVRIIVSREGITRKIVDDLTESEAFELEMLMIADLCRCPDGPLVNLTDGGDGIRNPSPETRRRMRLAKLGHVQSPEWVERRVGHRRGVSRSPGDCAKISAGQIGKKFSEERKAILRAASRHKDPAVRARISAATKEAWKDPAKRAAMLSNRRSNASWPKRTASIDVLT